MTKQEILNYFRGINNAYNDCTRFDSLSNMIDELLKEQQETIESLQGTICKLNAALGRREQPEIVRCAKCAHGHLVSSGFCVCVKSGSVHYYDWFCADGERRQSGNESIDRL